MARAELDVPQTKRRMDEEEVEVVGGQQEKEAAVKVQ